MHFERRKLYFCICSSFLASRLSNTNYYECLNTLESSSFPESGGVFRTPRNIYDGAFSENGTRLARKISVIDV